VLISAVFGNLTVLINSIFNVPQIEFDKSLEYFYPCEATELGEIPILFARIDEKKYLAELQKKIEAKAKAAKKEEKKVAKPDHKDETPSVISIDDFAKIDLRVGQIKECVKAENSDKLLVLQLDMGNEIRQVVSGIAKYYTPDELIGKKVIVVSNLKPAKLRGIESNGMILAADTENGVKVLFADETANLGSRVR